MIAFVIFFLSIIFSTTTNAKLHGFEANHSLEECICCLPTAECLINVGPGKDVIGLTNKTYQHILFETIERELDNEPLLIEGVFPSWCAGSLFKNGFGKYEGKEYSFLSVFDAMGYTARITIFKNGSASVTAKITQTDWYNRSMGLSGYTAHIPPYRSFMGTTPSLDFLSYLRLMFTIVPDNLNVNIVRMGKHLFGISDMDGFNEIDPKTMDYVEYYRYSDFLSMTSSIFGILGIMTSAHPIVRASAPHIVYNFVAYPGGYLLSSLFFQLGISVMTIYASAIMLKTLSAGESYKRFTSFCIFLVSISMIRWSFLAMDGHINWVSVNKYTLYKIDTNKEPLHREVVISFPNNKLTYLHEMAISEKYIIFAEWPTFWNIQSISSPIFNDPSKLSLSWEPSYGTRITVVDTTLGSIASIHTDLGPYWSYHHISAYEDENGKIIMDACTFDSAEHLHTFETRTLKKNTFKIPKNINRRFIIPVGKPEEKVIVKNVGPIGFDLPTRNLEKVGRRYQFAYGTGHRNEGEWWNTLVKVNMDTGKTIQWYEEHTWPSQPVFIPNPERRTEDQGVLLTLMFDGKSHRSFILALDAENMHEIARGWIPIPLPYTSHGYFDVEFGGDKYATIIPGVDNGFRFQ